MAAADWLLPVLRTLPGIAAHTAASGVRACASPRTRGPQGRHAHGRPCPSCPAGPRRQRGLFGVESLSNFQGRLALIGGLILSPYPPSPVPSPCIVCLGSRAERGALPSSLLPLTPPQEQQVDGDLLLRLTEEELQTDLGMVSSITRKRYGASCQPPLHPPTLNTPSATGPSESGLQ